MNKEEMNCIYSTNGITTMSTKQYDNYIKIINDLKKENKILRENAEHNDKVVDKVNWEINILKHNRDKAIEYLEEKYERPISYYCCIKETLKILKGDSDE